MVLKATIIIPAYNEQDNIQDVIEDVISSVKYENFDVLVIDDGSTDKTNEICQELKQKYSNLEIMKNEPNLGKTLSIIKAIKLCKTDVVALIDGDNQFYAKDLNGILALTEYYDVVCGKIKNKYDSFHRKFMSRSFNLFNWAMFRIQVDDVNCGMKAFRTDIFKDMEIKFTKARWFIDTELLARSYHRKLQITQLEINHKKRTKGESKVNTLKLATETLIYAVKLKWELLLPARREN